jgi:nicotinamidase-related amidase
LSIPIYATTQSAARLGPLCAELFPPSITPTFQIDKTEFSMLVPELYDRLKSGSDRPYQVAITGIEAHICVSQTALDLVAEGHAVYVLADGVSSSHHAEAKVALDRLSQAGVIITTSEAWLYECMGNANIDKYVVAFPLERRTMEDNGGSREAVVSVC